MKVISKAPLDVDVQLGGIVPVAFSGEAAVAMGVVKHLHRKVDRLQGDDQELVGGV